jgi:hypothetical protein
MFVTRIYFSEDKPLRENYGSPLPNGDSLSYRLDQNLLKDAEGIDNNIRSLIELFT